MFALANNRVIKIINDYHFCKKNGLDLTKIVKKLEKYEKNLMIFQKNLSKHLNEFIKYLNEKDVNKNVVEFYDKMIDLLKYMENKLNKIPPTQCEYISLKYYHYFYLYRNISNITNTDDDTCFDCKTKLMLITKCYKCNKTYCLYCQNSVIYNTIFYYCGNCYPNNWVWTNNSISCKLNVSDHLFFGSKFSLLKLKIYEKRIVLYCHKIYFEFDINCELTQLMIGCVLDGKVCFGKVIKLPDNVHELNEFTYDANMGDDYHYLMDLYHVTQDTKIKTATIRLLYNTKTIFADNCYND